jgi:hypothetical protein
MRAVYRLTQGRVGCRKIARQETLTPTRRLKLALVLAAAVASAPWAARLPAVPGTSPATTLQSVIQLDALDATRSVVLARTRGGINLDAVVLP